MLLSTTRVAQLEGVTTQTVRRWLSQGKLKATRTRGGHFRIDYHGELETVLYARVSSSKQKTSIETQRKLLEHAYPQSEFLSDIGSGFNFKRQNFVRILERVMSGNPIRIVSAAPDRISRSGLSLIVRIIEFYGGEVVFPEDDNQPESFDTATLISFLTGFCNSQSGKRNNRHKKDKDISKE
ncbi:MAG: recombinase family protein [Desulfobacteraceae bacterium]|nr:recombinase family protein [Desulfobacteraceae bacterium]